MKLTKSAQLSLECALSELEETKKHIKNIKMAAQMTIRLKDEFDCAFGTIELAEKHIQNVIVGK